MKLLRKNSNERPLNKRLIINKVPIKKAHPGKLLGKNGTAHQASLLKDKKTSISLKQFKKRGILHHHEITQKTINTLKKRSIEAQNKYKPSGIVKSIIGLPYNKIGDAVIVFLLFFFIMGFFVTSEDQNAFTLQQAGVEALVERGALYVDGSQTPKLAHVGDTFTWKDGHQYAGKQPGQFFIAGIVYAVLKIFNIRYINNYTLTATLVTWFTSGAMAAFMATLLYLMVSYITGKKGIGLLIATFFALGTITLPYSGVTHHDIYGAFFAFTSFFLIYKHYHINKNKKIIYMLLAGASAALAVFCSMLTFFVIVAVGLYVISYLKIKDILLFGAAFAVFLIPTLAFNYAAFGNPFTPPNIAGDFQDTFAKFSVKNLQNKLHFYITSFSTGIFMYSPVLIFGFIGLIFLPLKYIREKIFLFVQFLILLGYLTMMETVGHSQYGPRYLLPTLPFLCVGLAAYWTVPKSELLNDIINYKYFKPLVITTGIASIVFCIPGALHTVMYSSTHIWAFKYFLGKSIAGQAPERLLRVPSLLLLIIPTLLFLIKYFEQIMQYVLPRFRAVKEKTLVLNQGALKAHYYIVIILVLAAILRLAFLSDNPNGLYVDEASIGYNSYSILKTGKDEHGEVMPLYFRAFGEYKNPVYIYFAVPFIKIFGLNEFGLRFTSAFFGVLTILFLYLLVKHLFDTKTALIAALMLAISPWHLHFSRIAFEAISLPCFFVAGFYFLVKGLEKGKYLIPGFILMALTPYTYAPAKAFVPLFLLVYFILNIKTLFRFRRYIVIGAVLALLLSIPIINSTFYGHGQSRFNTISILSDHSVNDVKNNILNGRYPAVPFSKKLVNYKNFVIGYHFVRNYLLHISPRFLFLKGDFNPRHSVGGVGQLYIFEFILLIIGLIGLIMRFKKKNLLIIWWLLLFPVAASLTYESVPHAIRSLYGVPVFQIIAAVGLVFLYSFIKDLKRKQIRRIYAYALIPITIALVVLSYSNIKNYMHTYFTKYPNDTHGAWNYGMKDLYKTTENMKQFQEIGFYGDHDQPYIFALFYPKYDPAKWHQTKKHERYKFKSSLKNKSRKRMAVVTRPNGLPQYKKIHTIYDPWGNAMFDIKEIVQKKKDIVVKQSIPQKFIGGLKGYYYNDKDHNNLAFTRIDPAINFDWVKGSPDPRVRPDDFSIKWKGWIKIDRDDTYSFTTSSDDGVRLYIDDDIIIENYNPHPVTDDSGSVQLKKGWHQIEIEFYELGYEAVIKLYWSTRYNSTRQIVPADHLSFME